MHSNHRQPCSLAPDSAAGGLVTGLPLARSRAILPAAMETYERPAIAGSGVIACGLAACASAASRIHLLARSDASAWRAGGEGPGPGAEAAPGRPPPGGGAE